MEVGGTLANVLPGPARSASMSCLSTSIRESDLAGFSDRSAKERGDQIR